MTTFVFALMLKFCSGDSYCYKYINSCTQWMVVHGPPMQALDDLEERAVVDLSVCEAQWKNHEAYE